MKALRPKVREGPEAKIQKAIIAMLKTKDWLVKSTHGNAFQSGFADLYCAHRRYGTRWVEVKNPLSYSFTRAQVEFFPLLGAHGVGVWILTAATEDEYNKLFRPANWLAYFMPKV